MWWFRGGYRVALGGGYLVVDDVDGVVDNVPSPARPSSYRAGFQAFSCDKAALSREILRE